MKIPQLARYNGSVAKAYEFCEQNITEYPVNLFEIIKKFKWGLLTYEEMAKKNNCTIEDISECLGLDGYSIYNGKNYTIVYNNERKSERINFTIAHEIGHIILDHHKDFDVTSVLKDNFSKEEYKILENEANCFARNILAPAPLSQKVPFLFRALKLNDIFNISFSAQNTRLNFLKSDLNYLTVTQIFSMQEKYDTYYSCRNCNNNHINKNYNYCPLCGSSKLKEGNGFMIYKNEIELDKEKKAKICPKCHNEEILNGSHCKICGFELFNRCTNFETDNYGNIIEGCAEICDANARYCHKCGFKTTFFQNGLLCDYKDYKEPVDSTHKQMWNERVQTLKKEGKIMLYTNLIHTDLLEIDDNTIGINYPDGLAPFTKTLINKKENEDFINLMIKDIYGVKKKIKFYDKSVDIESNISDDGLPF